MTKRNRDSGSWAPESIVRILSDSLAQSVQLAGEHRSVMSGAAVRMQTDNGDLFVKWCPGQESSGLRAEAAGLGELASALQSSVPEICYAAGDDPFILAMRWIESGDRRSAYWEELAWLLWNVHQTHRTRYGFESDNFIGATPQQNAWRNEWPAFFREQRLEPQHRLAQEDGTWRSSWTKPFETLLSRLEELLPLDPGASLVHGDLWSGNAMVTEKGSPVLIDPAVYHGHFEVDLSMARLFGGFTERFFEAYAELTASPVFSSERTAIYNLYHLLNHLHLFGDGYAPGVERILRRFR